MKIQTLCFLALLAPLHAENLFSNGTMDTAGGWKGGKIVKEEPVKGAAVKEDMIKAGAQGLPNRYLQLTAKKSGPVSFSQEVITKGLLSVALKFRYQTKDYKGPGLEIRGTRMDDGATFLNNDLKADGQWHEMSWVFMQVAGSKKIDFSFILLQGEGEVFFDDVSAEASSK